MRILLDACVLYPTIMREVLLGAAKAGAFEPVWSARILEEWRRAAARYGSEHAQVAGVEIALVRANWPQAEVTGANEDGLWLPDENDVHVLAAAIKSEAKAIITLNLKDFPTRILSKHGLLRRDPDGFLMEFADENRVAVQKIANDIRTAAEGHSGEQKEIRNLLKRTGLPRLGKLLSAQT
jgi:predicted nucleic acid-binding protein